MPFQGVVVPSKGQIRLHARVDDPRSLFEVFLVGIRPDEKELPEKPFTKAGPGGQ